MSYGPHWLVDEQCPTIDCVVLHAGVGMQRLRMVNLSRPTTTTLVVLADSLDEEDVKNGAKAPHLCCGRTRSGAAAYFPGWYSSACKPCSTGKILPNVNMFFMTR